MNNEKKGLNISAKSFITAIAVLFVLMILTYGITFVVPGGGIPFWKWILSPILVLGADDNVSLIAVIIFLLVIGGVFNCLDKCGLMKYMLDKITYHFGKERYKLMAIVTLFFMAMGAFIGSFEECVPLVPIVVALAIQLGWDESRTGVFCYVDVQWNLCRTLFCVYHSASRLHDDYCCIDILAGRYDFQCDCKTQRKLRNQLLEWFGKRASSSAYDFDGEFYQIHNGRRKCA